MEVTVFICVSCRVSGAEGERPGRILFDAVTAGVQDRPGCGLTVTPVECLSVCNRPCTIALAAAGKWSYIVADLHHDAQVDDVISTARRYGTTADGIIPWRERPISFRKGVVSRVPPIGFRPPGADG